ncbi:GroES-like protein [Thozetella sp. PMI_491]|nr:GroES-like protein [Thozetella sp. PMI_491]
MSNLQTALAVTEVGKPLVQIKRPIYKPGPNQVLLKVKVAGLNPHDQKCRDHGLFIAGHLPAVLAADVVRVVRKIGADVEGITVGDRIVSQPDFETKWKHCGLPEYALASVGSFARIPDSISDNEAATLPSNLLAPFIALFKELDIPAPWSAATKYFNYANAMLLIIGGGSSCGKEVVGDNLIYAYDAGNPPEGQILAANALSNHRKGALARLVVSRPIDESEVTGKKAGFEVKDVFGVSSIHRELSQFFWDRLPGFLESGALKPLHYVTKNAPGLNPVPVNEVLDAFRDKRAVIKTHITF